MSRTLLITPSYMAHQIVSWERSIVMIFQGKIDNIEDTYSIDAGRLNAISMRAFPHVCKAYGRTPDDGRGDLTLNIPSVARLSRQVTPIKRGVKFSRINVFTRDGFRCQYCRKVKQMNELNYDHVNPRHLGGRTVWENIVTSCYPCNSFKANRTPEQAGMKLLKHPVRPKWLPMVGPRFSVKETAPAWIPYLGTNWEDSAVALRESPPQLRWAFTSK